MRWLPRWHRHEWVPTGRFVLHAAVCGSSATPTVVCVHGLGASHRYFLPFASAMAGQAEVVAPDLPGFGRTPGPPEALDVRGLSLVLAEWLRVTGRGGSVMVANSAGCQVLVDLAAHAPELLGPVVLNSPTMDARARSGLRQAGRLALDVPLEAPGLHLVLLRDYLSTGPRRFARTLRSFLRDPIERTLPAVRVPVVVVRGALDPVVPRAWAQQVAGLLPSSRYTEVRVGGHALNWSRPRALAGVVAPLLLGASAAPPELVGETP